MSNYAFEGPKWGSNTVTWSFATTTYSQDAATPFSSSIGSAYQSTISQAVQDWAKASGLNLTQVADSSSVNIRIGFGLLNTASTYTVGYTSYHWVYNAAGQQVFSPDTVVRLEDPGQVALNPSSTGGYTYQGFYTTLYQTALHELGHALGLDHSTDVQAIMSPTLGLSNPTMDANDITGITTLYPAGASVTPSPAPAPAPSPTPTPSTKPTKTPPAKGHKALAELNQQDGSVVADLSASGLHGAAPAFVVPHAETGAENTIGGDWGDGVAGVPIEAAIDPASLLPGTNGWGAHQPATTDTGFGGVLPVGSQVLADWALGSANQLWSGCDSVR